MKKEDRKGLFLPDHEPGGVVFEPSDELVEMFYRNILWPDDPETIKFIKELQGLIGLISGRPVALEEQLKNVKRLVTRDVYGFVTSVAKYIYFKKGRNELVLSGEMFFSMLEKEAYNGFGLNESQDLPVLLSFLQKEIIDFFSVLRETVWGSVVIDDGGVKFTIKKDVFKLPDFPKPDDPGWETK